MWPAFAAELQAAAGQEVGFLRTGTLLLARDEDEARELERQIAFRDSLGLATNRLRPSEAREREPALAPSVRLALEAPDDHSVDPRLVLAALRAACRSAGVQLREHAPVARIESDAAGERVTGVTLDAGGEFLAAERIVLAAGAWTGEIGGLADEARVPVRPVKGQLLRLRDPAGPGLLQRRRALRGRLPRAARGRPLRARRDGRGAGL